MSKEPTLAEVNAALEEIESFMDHCDDHTQLQVFGVLYAKAYILKLRLMKESPHASR